MFEIYIYVDKSCILAFYLTNGDNSIQYPIHHTRDNY